MYLAQDKTLLARERFTVKLTKPRTVEIFQRCSLCFALPPVYGGPQLSHQNKMLTSNSNHSHQIQITHSKLKIRSVQNADCRLQTADRVQNAD